MTYVAELTPLLRDIACLAGYGLATPVLAILVILRFHSWLHGDPSYRPSNFTLFFAACIAGALILPCEWDITFQPSPARW